MDRKRKATEIMKLLEEHYRIGKCFLNHETPWQLLFATILSAQCTDAQVNRITEKLFLKYKTLGDFAGADSDEFMEDIKSAGFYQNKAKGIIGSARMIIESFGGEVPQTVGELTSLPGVGRKTANIVLGQAFGIPSVAVDTHVKRVSYKLGLTESTEPDKIESDLMEALPEEHWIRWNTLIIAHGRAVCTAKKPNCMGCFLCGYCLRKKNKSILTTKEHKEHKKIKPFTHRAHRET